MTGNNPLSIDEKYRPKLHLTATKGWLNDPNGLIFYNSEFHQFYQYHPHSTQWGPMHWGHQTSKDLINWTEQKIALAPDNQGMCFSGSAVYDKDN
jgi:fructan beta-fructosidase